MFPVPVPRGKSEGTGKRPKKASCCLVQLLRSGGSMGLLGLENHSSIPHWVASNWMELPSDWKLGSPLSLIHSPCRDPSLWVLVPSYWVLILFLCVLTPSLWVLAPLSWVKAWPAQLQARISTNCAFGPAAVPVLPISPASLPPQNPPNFLRASALSEHISPVVVIPAEASSPDNEPITDLVEMDAASQVRMVGALCL